MAVPLLIPIANVTTLYPYPFYGTTGMLAKHDEHAGWRMPQFRLGYVGRRFSILGEDMHLDLVPCCLSCRDVEHLSIIVTRVRSSALGI